jgi:hypothetical protein
MSSNDPFDLWAKENVAATTDGPKVSPKVQEENPNQALQEKIAIAMAVGNNGGDWNSSYTREHRDIWRRRAQAVIELVDQDRGRKKK